MNQPLVSVVMPTYNQAPFIEEAIKSVLSQTYRHIELIIIDNFSTDNTRQIVESFVDPRVRYQPFANQGIIAASRNLGIKQAKGEYVAFIDSDDVWFENKLRLQIDAFNEDPEIGLVSCLFVVKGAGGDGKILGPKERGIRGHLYDQLLNSNFIVGSSVVVKGSVFGELGYFDESSELRCVEDFDLWLRIARSKKVVFIPEIQGIYRLHALNANVEESRLEKALRVIDKHYAHGWTTKQRADRAKANFYFREGWFLIGRDNKRARSYFKRALGLGSRSARLILLSMFGLTLSVLPWLYRFIRRRNLDRKINHKILNPQNL
ncbi:MAG: glycosyltransferase [Candidatus Omnitrophica bacterium]|nr:glycosyltransferase [Candidatus Omnitrophota bacterium]